MYESWVTCVQPLHARDKTISPLGTPQPSGANIVLMHRESEIDPYQQTIRDFNHVQQDITVTKKCVGCVVKYIK